MANELNLTYPVAAANLYAVVRRQSDTKVWSVANEAFETWDDADIAEYAIDLTDQSGDLYTADFPAKITTAMNCVVTYYLRAGATPATSDTILGRRWQAWDGVGLADAGGDITLSSYALTTLTKLKRYLGETSTDHDNILKELINACSDRIEQLTGRKFVARDYRHRFNGNREGRLVLDQYPILEVTRFAYGQDNALSVVYSGDGIRAIVEVNEDAVICRSWDANGAQTEDELTFADYPSTAALATAITAIADWSATCITNTLSPDLNPIGGTPLVSASRSTTVYLTYPGSDDCEFWVDRQSGIVSYKPGPSHAGWYPPDADIEARMPRGFQNILVEYRAGFATVPADLDMLCQEMAATGFSLSKRDQSVQSETLGDYSYTLMSGVALNDNQLAVVRRWSKLGVR